MWEKLERNEILFLLIDLQEKFYPLIEKQVLKNAKNNILLTINMAKKLGIPMIGTEHCVKNLGQTDKDVLEIWEGADFTDKATFSCLGDDAFVNNLDVCFSDMTEKQIASLKTASQVVANSKLGGLSEISLNIAQLDC